MFKFVCEKCGADPHKAAGRGAFLKRTNPTGEDFKGECSPGCNLTPTDDDSLPLRRALADGESIVNEKDYE